MSGEEALAWLEQACSLHRHIEIMYVVDGYEVRRTNDNGDTVASALAPTILEAVVLFKAHGHG